MADNTWKFLEHQESNPEALKQAVDTLIGYTKKKGMVTAVNVPLEEIEAFKDRAKTIIGKAAPKVEAEETEQKTLLDV